MRKIPFFLLNVLLALLLVWGIVAYVLNWLDNYTEHGKFVLVPDFEGMPISTACEQAEQNHLRVLVIDSVYYAHMDPGTVVEQYPSDGLPVKRNRLVHLTINAVSPEMVAVPNLQNTAYRQTLQTLSRKGFRIGRLEYEPSDFRHLVLYLKKDGEILEPGTQLVKGSIIDIVLGSGQGSNLVTMPLLTGKTLGEVLQILQNSYLNAGPFLKDETVTASVDSLEAIVIEQMPEPEMKVEAGTDVELSLSLDNEKIRMLDSLMNAALEDKKEVIRRKPLL